MTVASDPLAWSGILTGVTIGASGALVAAAVLGTRAWLHKRWNRRQQVVFVRRFVLEQFTAIRDAAPVLAENGRRAVKDHQIRCDTYREFLQYLEGALPSRLTALDHDRTHDLRLALVELKMDLTVATSIGILPDPEWYSLQYGKLRGRLDWLDLPPDLFPESDPCGPGQ